MNELSEWGKVRTTSRPRCLTSATVAAEAEAGSAGISANRLARHRPTRRGPRGIEVLPGFLVKRQRYHYQQRFVSNRAVEPSPGPRIQGIRQRREASRTLVAEHDEVLQPHAEPRRRV